MKPNSLKGYSEHINKISEYSFLKNKAYPKTAYCDDHYALAVLNFVKEQSQNYNKTGQPFFGLFAAQIPHAPFDEIARLPEWKKAYDNDPHFMKMKKQSQQWAAMVTRIDQHIGVILNALKDPNGDGDNSDSVENNTLVIFQSDNGGPSGDSREEYNANGGLRGSKGSVYEGGIRVPTIMKWPAMIHETSGYKKGSQEKKMMCVSNLLPTFCDLAGVEIPLGLDGVSIAPTLTGKGIQRHRAYLIHESPSTKSLIGERYKLIYHSRKSKGKKKASSTSQSKVELYDLLNDHSESNDISDKHPELVQQLKETLLAERVTESSGFSNTYHTWQGKDGDMVNQAENWSDYIYENAGVTYQNETGAPNVAWTADLSNEKDRLQKAHLKSDVSFLGLSISGKNGPQELIVHPNTTLEGRNEIKIQKYGKVTLENGSLNSMRWVDIKQGGELSGQGQVLTNLYHEGRFSLKGQSVIAGDYYSQPLSKLTVNHHSQLKVGGVAHLSGKLEVMGKIKTPFTLITAEKVVGKFDLEKSTIMTSEGQKLKVTYHSDSVILK